MATTTSSTTAATASSLTNSLNITSDQYLKLLLTQLQNQNPLEPLNDAEFTTQLAQLSSVSTLSQLNTNFSNLLQVQQLTGGGNLIGKKVTYTPTTGSGVSSGVVTGLSVQSGNLLLAVNNTSIPLSQVQSVN